MAFHGKLSIMNVPLRKPMTLAEFLDWEELLWRSICVNYRNGWPYATRGQAPGAEDVSELASARIGEVSSGIASGVTDRNRRIEEIRRLYASPSRRSRLLRAS
jgi:hypothetical protein